MNKKMTLSRRELLKIMSASAAGVSLGGVSSQLFAAGDSYNGPLWLVVNAAGGWDPTSFCDPKGYAGPQDANNPLRVNNYDQADITQQGNIRLAPPPEIFRPGGIYHDPNLFSTEQFFAKYHQQLLVINGIDSNTNSHNDGQLFNFAGRLRNNYPSFSALAAATLSPDLPLAFMTYGGYSESADLLTPVRVRNSALNALFEIAYPNRSYSPKLADSRQYTTDAIEQLIKQTSQNRHEAQLNQQFLPRVRAAIQKLLQTRGTRFNLQGFADNLLNIAPRSASTFNNRKKAYALYLQGRVALAAFQQGLTVSTSIFMRGFDTHSRHDQTHYPLLMDLFQGIDAVLDEAAARGLADRIVVIITSDFGRTPAYNLQEGKDHWPIGSTMLMGNSVQRIRGNRVIGASTDQLDAIAIDPFTLESDITGTNPNAIVLTPAQIHQSLRRLAGIADHPISLAYPLEGPELELFS